MVCRTVLIENSISVIIFLKKRRKPLSPFQYPVHEFMIAEHCSTIRRRSHVSRDCVPAPVGGWRVCHDHVLIFPADSILYLELVRIGIDSAVAGQGISFQKLRENRAVVIFPGTEFSRHFMLFR